MSGEAVRGALAVARMEFQLAMVSRLTVALGAFFVLIVAAGTHLALSGLDTAAGTFLNAHQAQAVLMVTIASTLAFLGPIVPIVSSVLSIVEERSTRTIEMLLSRPVSRRGLVAGKILGRTAHVVTITVVGVAIGFLVVSSKVQPEPMAAAVLIGLAAVHSAVWVALAMLLSSVVRRPTTALVSAFGVWFAFLIWAPILGLLRMPALAAYTNPNTLFLGAVQRHVFGFSGTEGGGGGAQVEEVLAFSRAFTQGLDVDVALAALLLVLALACAAAVQVFHRQEEAAA